MSAAGISGASRKAGFGEGTPQQVSREGQNRRIADFGTVVETCSKKLPDCRSLTTATFSGNRNQRFFIKAAGWRSPFVPYKPQKGRMDGLPGKNFSGVLVFPDNKAFRKLRSARCSMENGKFPCSHISTDTFPVCQKWAKKSSKSFSDLLLHTPLRCGGIFSFYGGSVCQTGSCDYFEFCLLIMLNKLDNIRLPNAIPKYMLFFSAEKRHKQINIVADSNKHTLAIVSNLPIIFLSIFYLLAF